MPIKSLYRLHRTLSIIIGIPIFLWAISGLMHPLMTNVRPAIATQESPEYLLSSDILKTAIPLKTVLQNAGIHQSFRSRIVHMDSTWYYQVLSRQSPSNQVNKRSRITGTQNAYLSLLQARYFNLQTGRELAQGDKLYAASLARHFLSGKQSHINTTSPRIKSIQRVRDFTASYTYVNRLLPVEKVRFERADHIAIYVDTHNSQFAFALDQHRQNFNQFFGWFHTWSWMDSLPKLKAAIIALILLVALFTAGLGIYLAVKTRPKTSTSSRANKTTSTTLTKARKLHRTSAIIGSIFLICWAFSGLVHAIQNGRTPFYIQPVSNERIKTNLLPDSLDQTFTQLAESSHLSSIGLMQLNGKLFMESRPYDTAEGSKDLMLTGGVNATTKHYYGYEYRKNSIQSNHLSAWTPYTENQIARLMAALVLRKEANSSIGNKQLDHQISKTDTAGLQATYLTHFTEAYNFSDKVLPVWQISTSTSAAIQRGATSANNPIFIDASTGSLVKKADPFKQADALIFAFFHKHEFMAWAGKSAKDASTVLGVIIVITLLVIGYRLVYIKYKTKRKS
jgi:hypothetical protein